MTEKPLQERWERLEKKFIRSEVVPSDLIEIMEVAFFHGCAVYHKMVLDTHSLPEEKAMKRIKALTVELEDFRVKAKTKMEAIKESQDHVQH